MNKGEGTLSYQRSAFISRCTGSLLRRKSGSSGDQTFSYVYTQDPDTLDYSISNKNRLPSLQEMR